MTYDAAYYDAAYYDAYRSASGIPYGRHPVWLEFFASIAGRIVTEIGPRTALDAGCAKGLLVEALRDRGVDAEGVDVSEHAIGQVREDVRPHCRVASVLDPLPRRYDLVVCLEVLEHLPAADAARAVENLCAATDDVLFSSTPVDDGDPTHVDLQPVEAWAALFARQGFVRDLGFDAGFVAPHAMRFRRRAVAATELVRDYERALWAVRAQLADHERLNLALTGDRQALAAARDALAAEHEALAATHGALVAGHEALVAEAAGLRAEVARLEGGLAAAGRAIEETRTRLEAELAAARETADRLAQELETTRLRRARAQEQLAESLQQRYGLERALAELSAERARLERALAEATAERAGLEQALAREAGERARLEASLATEGARLREVQARLAGASAEATRLGEYVHAIEGTVTWMLAQRLRRVRARWAPPGSRRARALGWLTALARGVLGGGRAPVMRTLAAPTPPLPAAALEAPGQLRGAAAEGAPPAEPAAPGTGTVAEQAPAIPTRAGGRRVLMISGSHGSMERYRCHHAREQLESVGIACDLRHFTQPGIGALLPGAEVLVLHRVPFAEPVGELIAAARRHGLPVLFDVDDLVFDPSVADRLAVLEHLTTEERALYLDGVCRYRQTLERCDGALVTTEALADAVAALGKPAWVHRNGLGRDMIALSEAARAGRRARPERVVIGYASGSRTHDRDFAEAADAVEAMLERHPHVDLTIIGHLDLGLRWRRWGERVRHLPFVPWQELPALLADLDLNLAPLEMGSVFCAAKSELKYVEAAAVGVPTVASRVGAFEVAIRHGDTGLLAATPEEWLAALEELILSPEARRAMGARARADVLARYGPAVRAAELRATLDAALAALQAPGGWPAGGAAGRPLTVFKEHQLAHELLDGLRGLEIGAAAHNPFGLDTRNVATPEDYAFYAEHQLRELGHYPARVDLWAPADRLPVPDRSEDFVLSSHVVEHLPDLVGALVEWNRVVRDGGYVFMIVPLKGVLPEDGPRPLTPLAHFVEDWERRMNVETHPTDGVPGGALGHYHTFTPDSLLEVVEWMRGRGLCAWELVAREDVDSKVGNGFTLVFRVRHA